VAAAPPFWDDLAAAASAAPWAKLEAREGYAHLSLRLPDGVSGLSERAAELVRAFPMKDGHHEVRIDVRNAQWAAMALELLAAAGAR
jgi:hypothetical protein